MAVRSQEVLSLAKPYHYLFTCNLRVLSSSPNFRKEVASFEFQEVLVDSLQVEVQLERPARLDLEILGLPIDPHALETILIEAHNVRGNLVGSFPPHRLKAPLGPFPPGRTLFTVQDFLRGELVEPFWLNLRPGENRKSIRISPRYELVVEAELNATLTLRRLDFPVFRDSFSPVVQPKADGRAYRFVDLLPGEYSLLLERAPAPGQFGMRLSIEGDATIEFEGEPVRSLLVRVPPSLEDCPFEDGDWILGVDEKEFANAKELLTWLDGTSSIWVERQGERISVEFEGDDWLSITVRGCEFIPSVRERSGR